METSLELVSAQPSQRLGPSADFVRPGSEWPTSPAKDVREVQNRVTQSIKELLRLERSIAFIGDNGNGEYSDTDRLKAVLAIIVPLVTLYNFREIDEAMRSMFEILSPWAACAIQDPDEDTRWKYWVHRCNLRLIHTIEPHAVASLPKEQVDLLEIYSQAAKHAIVVGDGMAPIWANNAAAAAAAISPSRQSETGGGGKLKGGLAALRRQLSRTRKPST